MPWNATYDPDRAVVRTTYSGIMPPAELEDAFRATMDLAARHCATRFFADCRALEGGHSVLDLFRKVQQLGRSALSRDAREAVVLPADGPMRADVRFWETAARNRGFNVRVFPDSDSAEAWLLADPE